MPFSLPKAGKNKNTGERERRAGERGNFNRKTTLHSEGKMHKAQKDEGRDTLMLMLTLRRQTTQKGVNQGETEKRSESKREKGSSSLCTAKKYTSKGRRQA